MAESGRSVFVTVGTTLFDGLIQAVDSQDFQEMLISKEFQKLLVQIGKGKHVPKKQYREGVGDLKVESFDFKPSLAPFVHSASLVVSHAGSGSIFETLRAGKALVVVVNKALMDNHQRELADILEKNGHLLCASPETLTKSVESFDPSKLVPYPPLEADRFAHALDSFLGFPDP